MYILTPTKRKINVLAEPPNTILKTNFQLTGNVIFKELRRIILVTNKQVM